MPYCMNCLKELNEKDLQCPACGTETWYSKNKKAGVVEQEEVPVPKSFTVLGKIGHIIGIVTLILAFVPYVNLISSEVAIVGIVFCILGKKDKSIKRKCKKGLKLSIWALVLSIVLYIVYTIIFALLAK